jgi:hypothetical protein
MLRLTEAGAEILPLARKTLADLDAVVGSSAELKTLGRGRVSIAASSVQAAMVLPRVIRELLRGAAGGPSAGCEAGAGLARPARRAADRAAQGQPRAHGAPRRTRAAARPGAERISASGR